MKKKRWPMFRFVFCIVCCVWLFSFIITIDIHLTTTAKHFIDSQTNQWNKDLTITNSSDRDFLHRLPKKLPKGLKAYNRTFLRLVADENDADAFHNIFLPPKLQNFEQYYNDNNGIKNETLVCGYRRKTKGFLTIGIPTVKRRFNNYFYLNYTLHSLIGNMNVVTHDRVVVVIMMADRNTSWNKQTSSSLCSEFRQHFSSGLFQIIIPPPSIYPSFTELNRTKADSVERVVWRSKQNVDFAYLMLYSKGLNKYYIQLEDDIQFAPNFMMEIQKFIMRQRRKWVLLEFSKLGFIGKLFHSADLLAIAVALLENFTLLPCDLLLGGIRILMGQRAPLHTNTSLFQHIGKISTLNNKMMPSVDKSFKGFGSGIIPIVPMPKGVKPKARFETNMKTVSGYYPENIYENGSFYLATEVRKKQKFQIIFPKPINITRLLISTGDYYNKSDILLYGALKLGAGFDFQNTCGNLVDVVDFVDGEIDTLIQGADLPENVNCVHIEAKKRQKHDLMIRNIEIFLDKSKIL